MSAAINAGERGNSWVASSPSGWLRKGETRWKFDWKEERAFGRWEGWKNCGDWRLDGIVLSGVKLELESESGPIAMEMKDHKAEGGWWHESWKDKGKGARLDLNDEIRKIQDWPKQAN